MSANVKDFYGKDVAEAIKEACDTFGVAQENLAIEVIETGSKGIFGLIRQKAHIRVSVQPVDGDKATQPLESSAEATVEKPRKKARPPRAARKSSRPDSDRPKDKAEEAPPVPSKPVVELPDNEPDILDDNDSDTDNNVSEAAELSPESLAIINQELTAILDLMGCRSTVTVEDEEGTALCRVSADHEETLTGQDGRVLDSLQYLLRKIITKKISGRVQLTIDVGDYRERRYQQLREQAIEYAALVKENAKTQVIASLNPSERRVVHVALQDDPDIRSRSIGEGLFKKVLIYKPGKGRSNNRKRGRSKPRRKGGSGPKQET